MSWFKKKPDPLSDRARVLIHEIAHLEAEIKRLDAQLQRDQGPAPPPSPTVRPGTAPGHPPAAPATPPPAPARAHEPIFEDLDQNRLQDRAQPAGTAAPHDDLGVRKHDLPAFFRRFASFFHGPATSNPKLVSYLAAGGIQGLRPLRFEKRKQRRRFLFLVLLLFLLLLGTALELLRKR